MKKIEIQITNLKQFFRSVKKKHIFCFLNSRYLLLPCYIIPGKFRQRKICQYAWNILGQLACLFTSFKCRAVAERFNNVQCLKYYIDINGFYAFVPKNLHHYILFHVRNNTTGVWWFFLMETRLFTLWTIGLKKNSLHIH